MYESPIDVIMSDIQTQIIENQGEAIYQGVMNIGVHVNKDELIRALAYDRDQYDKGYADGKRDAMDEVVRCKDCKHFDRLFKEKGAVNEIGTCYLRKEEGIETAQICNDFCSYGERREGE